ncbi:MAG TPA: UDP binding domain-containing protein, partial [Anaerolineales bacterium]|nr:UDP binding domain-containing protein [Anaerolineales bacterium]
LRESPAVEVIHLLQKEGASVLACEPFKPDANLPGITIASTFDEAIKEADALLFLVKHAEFVKLIPQEVALQTRARIGIDTINGWNTEQWQSAGFQIVKLGSGKPYL